MSDTAIGVEEFRAEARAWLEANLIPRETGAVSSPYPRAAEPRTHESMVAQRAIQLRLYEGGFAGISFPTEYGGRGLTLAHERAFNEEARDFHTPDFGIIGGTTLICARTMLAHAAPELLHRHIPAILRGEELWAQFFSEPDAGSDLASVRTRATRDGDRWLLNGAKIWSSGAHYADYGMCLARTNWDVPKHRGLTWFAVPTDAEGLTIAPIVQITGDAEFCQEYFDDLVLSPDDVIGDIDQGWRVAQTMLVFERGGGGANLPVPSLTSKLAPDLVNLARRVGRDKDPLARQLIARAHINDYARSQLSSRIGSMMRASGGGNAGIAAYGKLASGTFRSVRSRITMQIGGPQTLLWESDDPAALAPAFEYLNSRVTGIAGGTNEMQRSGIGERVLGLPREPSFDSAKPFNEVIRDSHSWDGRVG